MLDVTWHVPTELKSSCYFHELWASWLDSLGCRVRPVLLCAGQVHSIQWYTFTWLCVGVMPLLVRGSRMACPACPNRTHMPNAGAPFSYPIYASYRSLGF